MLTNAAEAALEGGAAPPDPSIILRPFFTTKPQGTGIGLSLARQVMLAHGGDIAVQPATPAGLSVTLTF